MMQPVHIQVQAVLYENDREELARALAAAKAAAQMAREAGHRVSLIWGDASKSPLFTQESWQAFTAQRGAFSEMKYCFFNENTGYGAGNNRLAEGSEADFLLIMNPEILLPPDGILNLLAVFQDPAAGIAEARQIPVEHPKEFDPVTHETPWASGACLMIPRRLFQELHGFDMKTFFMYCEDVDLSWRVRLAGRKVIYQPQVGVFHARRLSLRGMNQPSRIEQIHTVLSEALLAYKWGYPEYARERIRMAAQMGSPGAREAQEAFRKLEEAGDLPAFMDPAHKIARIRQFPQNGGLLFARHRYAL